MNDFTLRPDRFSILDARLRLDPTIEAEIRGLQSGPPSPRLRNLVLSPNWAAFQQSDLDRILRMPLPPAAAPLVPRGRGPAKPRAAEVSDVLRGIWRTPTVRQGAQNLLDQLSTRVRRDWRNLSGGGKAAVITWSGMLAGGAITGVLMNEDTRKAVFDLIVGRDLPVPGVAGLTVRFKPRGVAASYRDIGGSGVSVKAGGGADEGGRAQYEATLMFDLAPYLRGM